MMNIPITKTVFGIEEEQAIITVLRSGWVVQGKSVAEFEEIRVQLLGSEMIISGCGSHHASHFYGPHPANHLPATRERLIASLQSQPGGSRCEQVLWAASGSEAIQKAVWAALDRRLGAVRSAAVGPAVAAAGGNVFDNKPDNIASVCA